MPEPVFTASTIPPLSASRPENEPLALSLPNASVGEPLPAAMIRTVQPVDADVVAVDIQGQLECTFTLPAPRRRGSCLHQRLQSAAKNDRVRYTNLPRRAPACARVISVRIRSPRRCSRWRRSPSDIPAVTSIKPSAASARRSDRHAAIAFELECRGRHQRAVVDDNIRRHQRRRRAKIRVAADAQDAGRGSRSCRSSCSRDC